MTECSLIAKKNRLRVHYAFGGDATVHEEPKKLRFMKPLGWIEAIHESIALWNHATYPFCVNCIGTSMLWDDERRRSPAMSAKRAKSVSRSWSAKRGERRDSDRRTSSNFLTNSNGAWNEIKIEKSFIDVSYFNRLFASIFFYLFLQQNQLYIRHF